MSRLPGSLTEKDFGEKFQWSLKGFKRTYFLVTSAMLLALNATPQTLVAAPGGGNVLLLDELFMYYSGGTAYAGIAAGEDLQVKYTNGAGAAASEVQEVTGWLDSVTGSLKVVQRLPAVAGTLNVYTTNAALVLHMLTGEITTGTGTIACETTYRQILSAIRL